MREIKASGMPSSGQDVAADEARCVAVGPACALPEVHTCLYLHSDLDRRMCYRWA